MPMWEGEEPTPSEGGPTPKQRLLNWIQSKVPDLPIKNFTTDWNDGKAIGALVDACGPGKSIVFWFDFCFGTQILLYPNDHVGAH